MAQPPEWTARALDHHDSATGRATGPHLCYARPSTAHTPTASAMEGRVMLVTHLCLLAVAAGGARAGLVFEAAALVANCSSRSDPVFAQSFGGGAAVTVLAQGCGETFESTDRGATWRALWSGELHAAIRPSATEAVFYGGNIPTWAAPGAVVESVATTEFTRIRLEGSSFNRTTVADPAQQIHFSGLPRPVLEFSTGSGGATRLPDGSFVALVVVWFNDTAPPQQLQQHQHHQPVQQHRGNGLPGPCCNDSVVAVRSTDGGQHWEYTATVADHRDFPGSQEGPNEATIALLQDNKTLLAVFRMDGGDGVPDHRHVPYMKATSADGGRTWTKPVPLPATVLSAKPELLMLTSGTLLLTGGRPGLRVWENPDGMGESWVEYDIPTEHNQLIGDPKLAFCPEFLHANQSLGWAESCGYNSLAAIDAHTAVVCYERQGAASGGYHKPAPPACKPAGAQVFCMRLSVASASP